MITTIIFICLGVLGLVFQYLQLRKKDTIIKNYQNKENNIHNQTQQIIQSPVYINFPPDVKSKINYIATSTGSTILLETQHNPPEDKIIWNQKDKEKKG